MADDLRRERNAIRARLRARRRALSRDERLRADRALCRRIAALPAFRAARSVGVFIAFDGEPDLRWLLASAAARSKRFFAPVISGAEIRFTEVPRRAKLARNYFGILEPAGGPRSAARALDLVLTPLVAFDAHGGRLGVGGGFYDRCFAFLRLRRAWLRPRLLGVAYSFQEIEPFALAPWDVPLWGVATEAGFKYTAGGRRACIIGS